MYVWILSDMFNGTRLCMFYRNTWSGIFHVFSFFSLSKSSQKWIQNFWYSLSDWNPCHSPLLLSHVLHLTHPQVCLCLQMPSHTNGCPLCAGGQHLSPAPAPLLPDPAPVSQHALPSSTLVRSPPGSQCVPFKTSVTPFSSNLPAVSRLTDDPGTTGVCTARVHLNAGLFLSYVQQSWDLCLTEYVEVEMRLERAECRSCLDFWVHGGLAAHTMFLILFSLIVYFYSTYTGVIYLLSDSLWKRKLWSICTLC